MAAKTSEWRPGPTVCRCCLSEGCYKDISTEYFWMGKREVYAEMLADTFDLSIAYSQSGGPNSNSRLICEPCISRLRDAADFKRQVVECEKTFLQHLDPSSSSITSFEVTGEELPPDPENEVKLERIKIEKLGSDEEFDPGPDFADADDDDDDMDDEPLTKLASRIPKTESMDATDLMDNANATLTEPNLKRKSSSRTKATPAKKLKAKKESKASASKAKPEKKKKDEKDDSLRKNAETIIHYSTAYPFRVHEKTIRCVYCYEKFSDPEVFRMHMDDDHRTFSLRLAFHNIPKAECIKADLSDLRCRLCDEKFDDLDSTVRHLSTVHEKPVDAKANLGIMPFKLQRECYTCAVCQLKMPTLNVLCRHTVTHFLSHSCNVCGGKYLTESAMIRHVRHKHQAYPMSCKICGGAFPTVEEMLRHRLVGRQCMPYTCSECPERFIDWKAKMYHLRHKHGRGVKDYRCDVCSLIFAEEKEYYMHLRLEHSTMSAACKRCGQKFTSVYALKRHHAEKCD